MMAYYPDQQPFSPPSLQQQHYSHLPTPTADNETIFYPPSLSRASESSPRSLSISEDSFQVPLHWFLNGVTVHSSKVLGRGSFGTVCLGEWLGCPVAIKKPHDIFFDKSVSEDERRGILKTFAREVNILFQLKHPNIVLFYGLHDAGGNGDPGDTLSSDTCLVQELLQCSLSARNRQSPRLTYRNTIDLSLGIVGGLRYLHERKEPIVHRDLASKNILLNQNGVPKIADLGVAKVISSSHKFIHLSRQPGTELYMPPEVKIEGMQYDCGIDVYSFGVLMLEMAVGRDPTAGEAFRTSGSMVGGDLHLVPEVERRRRDFLDLGDSPLKPLILHCLTRKDERPSTMAVFEKLVKLKGERSYTSQLETPVMPQQQQRHSFEQWQQQQQIQHPSAHQHQWYQEKVKQLEEEKEELLAKLAMGKREGGSLPNRLDDLANTYPTAGNHSANRLSDAEFIRVHKAYLEKMQQDQQQQYGNQADQNRIRLLEATIRSRDSEIGNLRERNIRLEQEVANFQDAYSSGSFHHGEKFSPPGLLVRGVPASPPYNSSNGGNGGIGNKHVTNRATRTNSDSELKQLKRNVEKYKNLIVELDSKLKDAKLEISKYETRQSGDHVQARYENDALRSENCVLKSELDRLRRECSHLQSQQHYHRY